ncbi:hypothetical protein Lal_00004562 [Lupinus albus]|nr:hypothetical protein Lal_00004562 [Lupinus albus]
METHREREASLDLYSPCDFLYSPCHFFEQVVKAFSKCLCLDAEDSPESGTRTTSQAMKRPPRPPLSAGRGGQINLISS